jgi:hypothetical protein
MEKDFLLLGSGLELLLQTHQPAIQEVLVRICNE